MPCRHLLLRSSLVSGRHIYGELADECSYHCRHCQRRLLKCLQYQRVEDRLDHGCYHRHLNHHLSSSDGLQNSTNAFLKSEALSVTVHTILSKPPVAYLGFEKGGGADLYMPFPSPPFPSPLAYTPPSPPSPLYFLALPSQPFPPLLPSHPLVRGVRGYNPRKIF
jgi:hypothetical protein